MPLCFKCSFDLTGYVIEIFHVEGKNMGMIKGSPGRPTFKSHNRVAKTGEVDWKTYVPVGYECPNCGERTKSLSQLINWTNSRQPASARR